MASCNRKYKRFAKCCPFWELISDRNQNEELRHYLIDNMNDKEMKDVKDVLHGISTGAIKLPKDAIKKLAKNRNEIEKLYGDSTSMVGKKRILKQHGGIFGLIAPLLSPLIGAAVGEIGKLVRR